MQRGLSHFELKSLTTGALFKLGLISNLSIWLIIGILFAVGALAGLDIVSWNRAYVHGIGGVLAALFVAGVFCLIGSVMFLIGGAIAKAVDRAWSLGRFDIEVANEAPADAHTPPDGA